MQADQVRGHQREVVVGLKGGARNCAVWLEQKSVGPMKHLVAKFSKEGGAGGGLVYGDVLGGESRYNAFKARTVFLGARLILCALMCRSHLL